MKFHACVILAAVMSRAVLAEETPEERLVAERARERTRISLILAKKQAEKNRRLESLRWIMLEPDSVEAQIALYRPAPERKPASLDEVVREDTQKWMEKERAEQDEKRNNLFTGSDEASKRMRHGLDDLHNKYNHTTPLPRTGKLKSLETFLQTDSGYN